MSDNAQMAVVSAAIGAGSAIIANVIGQAVTLWMAARQRRHDWRSRQRRRIEEISELIAESIEWCQTIQGMRKFERLVTQHPPASSRRIIVLSALYFPSLLDPATEFHNAMIRHFQFCLSSFDPNVPASVGTQIQLQIQSGNEDLRKQQEAPMLVRNHIDRALFSEAKKYCDA